MNGDPFYAVVEELVRALEEVRSLRGQVLTSESRVKRLADQIDELNATHKQELEKAHATMFAAQQLYAEESLRADSLQREMSELGV